VAKPAAPRLRIRRFAAGEWTEAPDAVVTEEPLQLLLNGEPLAVVMRTPGADIELALGLMFAEGIIRSARDVRGLRISAEAGETEDRIEVEPVLVESNQVDVQLAAKPRRKPERSMLASSACGVCGTQMIEDLRRDLAVLPPGLVADPAMLPGLVDRLRAGQGVFERTGGLHAAGLFDALGEVVALREDIGRHNAVDKVVGRMLLDDRPEVGWRRHSSAGRRRGALEPGRGAGARVQSDPGRIPSRRSLQRLLGCRAAYKGLMFQR
jgi:FdhD protein